LSVLLAVSWTISRFRSGASEVTRADLNRASAPFRYDVGIVFIRSIDTHAEYDRRNKARKKK